MDDQGKAETSEKARHPFLGIQLTCQGTCYL
jgi:hypothetical protein